jgi:osmotically-inducible protein OsmY
MSGHDAIAASEVFAAHIDEENPTVCEKIREAIVADKSLSLYAQNIQILAGPGGVTLYGPVKSHEERKRIEIDVAAVVKFRKIFNKLVVRAGHSLGRARSSQLQERHEEPKTEDECGRIRRLWGIRQRSRL